MKILLFNHVGLGDQLVMNSYVHYLLNTISNLEEIRIIAKKFQEKTLEHLYSAHPEIKYYFIDAEKENSIMNYDNDPFLLSINKMPFNSEITYNGQIYNLHNFGCHSSRPFNVFITNWADAFYFQVGLGPEIRKMFTFPSDMSRSNELYSKVREYLGSEDYILIHDDPSRNLKINQRVLESILQKNAQINSPVLYLGRGRYMQSLFANLNNKGSNQLLEVESLLDYSDLIKNAKECHFINSSIGILTDYIDDRKNDIYIHMYVTSNDPKSAGGQHIHFSKNFHYIDSL
jgi:hypothetical protein